MKKILSILLLPFMILAGCRTADQKNKPLTIEDTEALKTYLKEHEDALLIDVRTPKEFKFGHIPQAKLLPLQRLNQEAEKLIPSKETPIVLYCQSGYRSRKAAKELIKSGYQNVNDFGSISKWQSSLSTGI